MIDNENQISQPSQFIVNLSFYLIIITGTLCYIYDNTKLLGYTIFGFISISTIAIGFGLFTNIDKTVIKDAFNEYRQSIKHAVVILNIICFCFIICSLLGILTWYYFVKKQVYLINLNSTSVILTFILKLLIIISILTFITTYILNKLNPKLIDKKFSINLNKAILSTYKTLIGMVFITLIIVYIKTLSDFKNPAFIFLTGLNVIRLTFIGSSLLIIAYCIIHLVVNKSTLILEGISGIIIFSSSYSILYFNFIQGWKLHMFIHIIGFMSCFFQIKINFNTNKKYFISFVNKLQYAVKKYSIILLVSVLFAICFNFIFYGLLPGAEKYQKIYVDNVISGLSALSEATTFFSDFQTEVNKDPDSVNFELLTHLFITSVELQQSLECFKEIDSISLNANRKTWRKYNYLNMLEWISDIYINMLQYFYYNTIEVFKLIYTNPDLMKYYESIYKIKDLNSDEAKQIINKLKEDEIKDFFYMLLNSSKNVNDNYDNLKFMKYVDIFPLSKGIPVHEFFIGIETCTFIVLNYEELSIKYPEYIILIYRQEVIDKRLKSEVNYEKFKWRYSDPFILDSTIHFTFKSE